MSELIQRVKLPARVYLGAPTRGPGLSIPASTMYATEHNALSKIHAEGGGWLTKCFNVMYAAALNARAQGVTHFCLLHDDIEIKTRGWLDRMLSIMEANEADILSVVVPLKIETGLTSTAIDGMKVRRLTMTEIFNQAPTFTDENILLNTGVMLMSIRARWADDIWFENQDGIIQTEEGFKAVGVPEDWDFSRKARGIGLKMFATREIEVVHHGNGQWSNGHAWGTLVEDK